MESQAGGELITELNNLLPLFQLFQPGCRDALRAGQDARQATGYGAHGVRIAAEVDRRQDASLIALRVQQAPDDRLQSIST